MKSLTLSISLILLGLGSAMAATPTLYPVQMTSGSIVIENNTQRGSLIASLDPLNNEANNKIYSYPATDYVATYVSNSLGYSNQIGMPWSYSTSAPKELPHQPNFSTSVILQQGSLRCALGVAVYPQQPSISSPGAYFVGGNLGQPMNTCSLDNNDISVTTEANNTVLLIVNKLTT